MFRLLIQPSSGQLTIEQGLLCAHNMGSHTSNKALFIKIDIGATLEYFSSGVLILSSSIRIPELKSSSVAPISILINNALLTNVFLVTPT